MLPRLALSHCLRRVVFVVLLTFALIFFKLSPKEDG